MNEHAGPACALSGLIVGLFAVLLHDKLPPSAPAPPQDVSARPLGPRVETLPTILSPSPSMAQAPAVVSPALPVIVKTDQATPTTGHFRQESTKSVVDSVPETMGQPPRSPESDSSVGPKPIVSPLATRPTYAVVGPGESLPDIAARIYGSRDATQSLWKANRDQVERVDSPLANGILLRAP